MHKRMSTCSRFSDPIRVTTLIMRDATSVPPTNCTRASFHERLPDELRKLGTELLGSLFAKYQERLKLSTTRLLGCSMCMAHLATDDTLVQLRIEDKATERNLRSAINESTTGVVVDVGANMGEYAIAASRIAPSALVLTVEPVPPTYWILRVNLWLNGVNVLPESGLRNSSPHRGVVPVHAAIGSSAAASSHFAYFSLFRKSQAAFTTRDERPRSSFARGFYGGWKSRRVPVRSIEELVGQRTISLLKMDCEGCEFEAISAMPLAFFASHVRIERFVGEMHWGFVQVANTSKRVAAPHHPHLGAVHSTIAHLKARGCYLRGDEVGSTNPKTGRATALWHQRCPP